MKKVTPRIGKAVAQDEILFSCAARKKITAEEKKSLAFDSRFESRKIKAVEGNTHVVFTFRINGIKVSAKVFRKSLQERFDKEFGELQYECMKEEAEKKIRCYDGSETIKVRHCLPDGRRKEALFYE